jgi:arylformamidase
MLYDISPPLSPALAVWPGDAPLQREMQSEIRVGDRTTLSALRTTAHVGAHADAPSHIVADGTTIDQCELDTYVGPCQVVRVDPPAGGVVTPAMLPTEIVAPRVLLATGASTDRASFDRGFPAPSVELADLLHDRGVRLLGVDTPSVDRFEDETLPVHLRLIQHGIAILEGLMLADVPAGQYELIALPLRLVGFDGSPVRAVLRTRSATD